jgi:FkbM family methyltransferase
MMKRLAKTILGNLGYEIHRCSPHAPVGFHPAYLARIGQPQTVIDVGVGYGTYSLYEAFPHAKFILVEPLRDYEHVIEEIVKKYNCDIIHKAVGDKEGVREITVDTKDLEKSSFAVRTPLTATGNQLEKRLIEVITLDSILREASFLKQPILLKIDTEGHELSALQGSKSLLQITDTVIAEVSIAKRFEEGYEFEDLILFMKENGFYLFTVLGITHAIGELRPRFADIVFKRRPDTTEV